MMDDATWRLLQEVGYRVGLRDGKGWWAAQRTHIAGTLPDSDAAKAACLAHAESPEGLKANLPAALRLLGDAHIWKFGEKYCATNTLAKVGINGPHLTADYDSESPEAAAWALLKKVRGVA